VTTPEGVPLRFVVAEPGDRAGAFLLDALAISAGVLAIVVPLGWLAAVDALSSDVVLAGLVLALFLLRTFYFSFFELLWQGQTPGKRRLRIRAVDARGGPLTAEAILTRNLTRELEVFLPAMAIFAPDALFAGAPLGARLLSLAWMMLFGLLPLFNRDRLRVGDLVAGTIVVRQPDTVLLDDLTTGRDAPEVAFSAAQLEVYGEYELQVLEGVLRGEGTVGNAEAVRVVAERIRTKIGWQGPAGDDLTFLSAFYGALRRHLERSLLFGRRRAHKGDRPV
jgi:uncharacterized RDD family membrane protein YckC